MAGRLVDAHVDLEVARASDATKAPTLEHAEEARLQGQDFFVPGFVVGVDVRLGLGQPAAEAPDARGA